jgi:hypothetical protein
VLGNRRQAHLLQKRLRQIGNIGLTFREPREHRPPRRVGKSRESLTEIVLHNKPNS